MNGPARNVPPNNMLALQSPAFPQPPMGILAAGQPAAASNRYPAQQTNQHQQRPMLLRQTPNGPQPNPGPSMQAQLQTMHFPGNVLPQGPPGGGANVVRRVQSQPAINPLGGIPNAPMGMPLSQTQQMRAQAAVQSHQIRIHQQQAALMQAEMRSQGPSSSMPPNMARAASAQSQVMSSLGQPSSLAPMPHPGGPHHQNPFPNGGPMPSQHPPQLSSSPGPQQAHTPSLSMATPGPSHTPVNRPRMPPDDGGVSFMGYPGTQFPGNNPPRVPSTSNAAGYPFGTSSTPTPIPMDISQSSPPSGMHSQGGTPSRSSFMGTPAQAFDLMNTSQGMDIYSPSFTMGPPSTVPPPRPPSHATNPHQAMPSQPNPQQQNPMPQSQQQPHHQSPPQSDPMNVHPQRPQSQPQQMIPGRPPSQAGSTRTPRSMQIPLPPSNLAGSGSLTATGRLPAAQQPGTSGSTMMPPIVPRPPLAMGGVPLPPSANAPMTVDASQSGVPPSIQRGPIVSTQPSIFPGQGIQMLLRFSGVLSSETPTKFQLSFWSDFVKEYFTPKADLRLTLWKDNAKNEAKPFQIGVPIMPRFFLVTTQSGVKSMSITIDGAKERAHQHLSPGHHTMIECVSAVWTFKYTNGYIVNLRGPLTAHVVITSAAPPGSVAGSSGPQYAFKFEDFQFDANFHEKFVQLDAILGQREIEPLSPRIRNMSMNTNSPRTSSQAQQSEEDRRWEEPRLLINHASIPGEPVNAFGIPQATMRCLELAESVTSMGDLIAFSNETTLGPMDALKKLAQRIREQNAAAASGQPQQQPSQPHQQFINSVPQNMNTNPMAGNNNASGSSNPSTSNPFPPAIYQQQQPMGQPVNTLYSSAPSSITHPPNLPSSMNSPQNTSSSTANSPEKQPKTIPQQQQQAQQAPTPSQSGPAASPAVSSGGTTNTPAMANATPKRKLADTTSPTTGTSSEQPQPTTTTTKRNPRKRGRTNTQSGAG